MATKPNRSRHSAELLEAVQQMKAGD